MPIDLAHWRQLLSHHFAAVHTGSAPGSSFSGELEAHPVGEVEVYRVATTEHFVERSRQLIGDQSPRDIKIYAQFNGQAIISQGERSCHLGPGDMTIFAAHRPYVVRFPGPQEGVLLKFPATLVPTAESTVSDCAATVMSAHSDMGAIAFPGLKALSHPGHKLSAHAVELLLELIVHGFANNPDVHSVGRTDPLVERATALIEEHLADPELGVSMLAAALFVSPRYLQKKFAAQGTTISTVVRSMRLHRVRRDLTDPALREMSIHEIAQRHGIGDASHLSRTFKREFGLSPRQFRLSAVGR